jgi:hypothetical protein
MIDIFDKPKLDLNNLVCHSGGAVGTDTYFEKIGEEFGVKTKAYSYKTKYHTSPNKVEISEEDYLEGVQMIKRANLTLNRWGIHKYMNLLARNWAQVKYSNQIFAIGTIIESGKKCNRGFKNSCKYQIVAGGTGYAVQLSIDSMKEVYVFEQNREKWFKWSFNALRFVEVQSPKISVQDFAGIGTREINGSGINAIKNLYSKTFS